MDDKFELIEDFQTSKRSGVIIKDSDELQESFPEWRPEYYNASEHPLKMMVTFQ